VIDFICGFKQRNQFSLIRLSNEAKLVQEGGMERVPKWQSPGNAVWASCRESIGLASVRHKLYVEVEYDSYPQTILHYTVREKRFLYAFNIIILRLTPPPHFYSPISPFPPLPSPSVLHILPFPHSDRDPLHR
jgi:hypothetical protein